MPKYKIIRPIVHNQTLYVPATDPASANATSVSHGMKIPVDASGTIELDEAQASSFRHGQIAAFPASSPVSEEPKRQHGRTQR